MVWALILSLLLLSPVPAWADPVDDDWDVVPVEVDTVVDGEEPSLPDEVDSESSSVPSEPVQVQQVVQEITVDVPSEYYDADGVLLYSAAVPDVSVNAIGDSSPYSSVTPSTYVTICADIMPKLGWRDNYVFWRSGQYSYRLAYGDIKLSGSRFSGSVCTLVDFTYSNNTTGYLMSTSTGSVSLDAGNAIVYSNLGVYPVLSVPSDHMKLTSYFVVVACGVYLLHCLYSFLLRLGVRNVAE